MIAITGSAGFIGSALIWGLNLSGFDDILVVDDLQSDERWKNLVNLRYADFVHKNDFLEKLERGDFGDTIDGILHMGACSNTTERDANFLLKNNFEYTKRLAIWCVLHKKRFVYASSGATYGDGSLGFSDAHELIPYLKPLNMYGYSKQMFDCWALKNRFLDKIAGLKYMNVFGPNEYHKGDMRSVVHKAFEQIKTTGKVRLFKSYNPAYKDGWQMRDFIYVKDAVDMTLFIYANESINGIYNIGMGKARSFFDLASAVFAAMGKETNIEYIEMPETIRGKYQYFTQAEMSKLQRFKSGEAKWSLESGIFDYVKNYLLSEDPYLGNEFRRDLRKDDKV